MPHQTDIFTINFHHIGARNATHSIPVNAAFSDNLHWSYYDADEDCIDDISTKSGNLPSVTLYPYCIGREPGKTNFNHNLDPNSNSIYQLNEKYKKWYFTVLDINAGIIDYIFGDSFAVENSQEIEIYSLDHLHKSGKINTPCYLSMDVQGAEYDILLGAANLIKEDILCVHAEVEFRELYKGQKLFRDIDKYLAENDFEFIKFTNLESASPRRAPLHARADGLTNDGDALYFKSIESLIAQPNTETWIKLFKLALIAISHHVLEYALECVENAIRLQPKDCKHHLPPYVQFLKKLYALSQEGKYPQRFSEHYDYQKSKGRYASAESKQSESNQCFIRYIDKVADAIKKHGTSERICLIPNGKITQEYVANAKQNDIAIQIFDNFDSSKDVQPVSKVKAGDIVVITSLSHHETITEQLVNQYALPENNIYSLADILSNSNALAALFHDDETELERCLKDFDMADLAAKVKAKRMAFSF